MSAALKDRLFGAFIWSMITTLAVMFAASAFIAVVVIISALPE